MKLCDLLFFTAAALIGGVLWACSGCGLGAPMLFALAAAIIMGVLILSHSAKKERQNPHGDGKL